MAFIAIDAAQASQRHVRPHKHNEPIKWARSNINATRSPPADPGDKQA